MRMPSPAVFLISVVAVFGLTEAASARVMPVAQHKPAVVRQSRRSLLKNSRADEARRLAARRSSLVSLPSTYANADVGVEIRHPAEWNVEEVMEKDGTLTLVVIFLGPRGPEGVRSNSNLVLEEIPQGTSLKDYTQLAIDHESRLLDNYLLEHNEAVTLAGVPARQITFSASSEGTELRFRQVWMFKDGLVHVWTFADAREAFPQSIRTFEAMLASLILR